MKVYFATWMDSNFAAILNNKKEKTRLISFFFIRTQKKARKKLKKYCEDGTL